MGFCTIQSVALLYPTFTRGNPGQKPSDTLIQQFIDDVADIIIGILERRFNESITQIGTVNQWLVSLGLPDIENWYPGYAVTAGDIICDQNDPMSAQKAENSGTTGAGTAPPVFSSTYGVLTTDNTVIWQNIAQSRQLRVLERGNRYGAASQLGAVMASFGVASAKDLAKEYTEADWKPFKCELNAETLKGEPKDSGVFDFLFDPLASVQTPRPLMSGIAGGDQPVGVAANLEGVGDAFSKWGVDFGRKSPNSGWPR